jgi:hypothetical protein
MNLGLDRRRRDGPRVGGLECRPLRAWSAPKRRPIGRSISASDRRTLGGRPAVLTSALHGWATIVTSALGDRSGNITRALHGRATDLTRPLGGSPATIARTVATGASGLERPLAALASTVTRTVLIRAPQGTRAVVPAPLNDAATVARAIGPRSGGLSLAVALPALALEAAAIRRLVLSALDWWLLAAAVLSSGRALLTLGALLDLRGLRGLRPARGKRIRCRLQVCADSLRSDDET